MTFEPWIETAIRASVSEIQRRIKERHYVHVYRLGHWGPVMTTEEMAKIIRDFMLSAKEGLG